jgi:hypothetical protein
MNNGYFTWSPIFIFHCISLTSSYNEKCFRKKLVEKIETHFVFNNIFLENRAVSEIMWKNNTESGRPQTTIWRPRIACPIPKATNTHSEYVTLLLFHCKNGCTNALQCQAVCALPALWSPSGYRFRSGIFHKYSHQHTFSRVSKQRYNFPH